MATITRNNISNQTVTGTTDGDTITLQGFGSGDIVYGNQGADTITVTNSGGYLAARVYGGQGADTITGFGSNSVIYGNIGADSINLSVNASGSFVFGGQDNDVLSDTDSTANPAAANTGGSNALFGGNGSDTITITGSNSSAYGGQGADTINVSGGNALIYGNQDNDIITATGTRTTAFGGQGSDTINVAGANSLVYGNVGADSVTLTGGLTTAFGGQGADRIIASTAGSDLIYGNLDNDVISTGVAQGASIQATLYGGQGADILASTNVNSSLIGGQGTDTFISGSQAGTVTGNPAAFTSTNSTGTVIADFVSGTDKIDLGGTAAPTSTTFSAGNSIGTDNYTTAAMNANKTAGMYTFVTGKTESFLFYSTGAAINGVVLQNTLTLVASDIVVGTATANNLT